MKIVTRLGLVALAGVIWVGAASGAAAPKAAGPKIVETGGSVYPQRSYILTLPTPKTLSTSDLKVTENGRAVSGVSIGGQGGAAGTTAVVLAIDASASMEGTPITDAVDAARAFAAQMNPDEQVAIIAFNNGVHVIQPFTSDPSQVSKSLETVPKLAVGTKIYDAIDEALRQIGTTTSPNPSIILLSDGTDVGSVAHRADVLQQLRNSKVRVFSVGLHSKSFSPKTLGDIASASKGTFVEATGPEQLKSIFQSLANQLSREYTVQYQSHANPNARVAVAMRVNGVPGVARSAYKAPPLVIPSVPPYTPSTFERVIQSRYLVFGIAALLAALLGAAVVIAASATKAPLVQRVGDFVSVTGAAAEAARPKSPPRQSLITRFAARTSKSTWSERMAETLELADINADPSTFVLLSVVGTVLVMLVFYAILGPFGLLAGIATPLFIRAYVLSRVAKKRRTFADQLPDNLDVLASALRAGHSLVGALSVVAADATEPSKTEFQRVLSDESFGVQLEDAFKVSVDRMQNQDLDQVALVARLQREMGSNSAEVLDKVIETVRGRMELRRLVRTLTAQGRFSRWILTALPIGIAVVLTLISSSYMSPLFHKTLGQVFLVGAAIMIAIGSWSIGKIVDIRV